MGLIIGPPLVIGAGGGGLGGNVRYLDPVEAEYIRRKAGGSDTIASGKAKITKMLGKTLAWNQLTLNGNFADTSSWYPSSASYVTISISNNVAAVTSTNSGDYYAQQSFNNNHQGSLVPGHIYLFRGDAKAASVEQIVFYLYFGSGADNAKLRSTVANEWERHSTIFTCVTTQHNYIRLYTNIADETRYFRNIQLFDLTLMFGAGNEPSTVEEFEALFPLPYYEYNAGTLISNKATGIKTTGYGWEQTTPLNLATLTGKLNGQGSSVVVFPNGLRSAGTVCDEIVGNRAIKRIGSVDLGTKDYQMYSTEQGTLFRTSVPERKSGYISKDTPGLCSKYPVVEYNIRAEKTVSSPNSKSVDVIDSTYSDAATFKAAMSGVLLYYELETPEEYILDAPLPKKYKVDANGTEERLPADTASSVTAPISYDVEYPKPKE